MFRINIRDSSLLQILAIFGIYSSNISSPLVFLYRLLKRREMSSLIFTKRTKIITIIFQQIGLFIKWRLHKNKRKQISLKLLFPKVLIQDLKIASINFVWKANILIQKAHMGTFSNSFSRKVNKLSNSLNWLVVK